MCRACWFVPRAQGKSSITARLTPSQKATHCFCQLRLELARFGRSRPRICWRLHYRIEIRRILKTMPSPKANRPLIPECQVCCTTFSGCWEVILRVCPKCHPAPDVPVSYDALRVDGCSL